ncbi:MAG: hypothetical protein CM15mV48_750 [uncultured marine virus]|jgi:hypothetical protein|nr:MAG: hypothetical protein CM15mV48_750 [uncultured marine virus]|tara:strand:- start:99 stop:293 length:195 start_codon:yes stop_codon:yes gene_type:complete
MESYKLLFGKDFEDFVSEYVSSSLKEKDIIVQRRTIKKLLREAQTYWTLIKRGERLYDYDNKGS